MKLKSIHLQNYRAHKDLTVKFDSRFTVVAGVNGSGKTSLLNGIADGVMYVSQGGIFSKIRDAFPDEFYYSKVGSAHLCMVKTNGRFRFEPQYPIHIHPVIDFNEPETEENGLILKKDELASVGFKHVEEQDSSMSDINETFPLIAFYRAKRSWLTDAQSVNEMQAVQDKPFRMDGYKGWRDAGANTASLQNWIIAKCLERYQRCSETGLLFDQIKDDELALVNLALKHAVENISGLRYDMHQKGILVDWNAREGVEAASVLFDNLSDGERVIICLVADIARRICLLNPQLGERATVETPGVVLIDELDVHLHPKWQRLIVKGLKAAFPSLQFIAASHSPQILGELLPEEIVLLRSGGQDTQHPPVSYGLDSGQVLKEIMDAPARNEDVEKKVEQLFTHIEAGKLDMAETALAKLKSEAPHIPELAGAEALILRKKVLGR